MSTRTWEICKPSWSGRTRISARGNSTPVTPRVSAKQAFCALITVTASPPGTAGGRIFRSRPNDGPAANMAAQTAAMTSARYIGVLPAQEVAQEFPSGILAGWRFRLPGVRRPAIIPAFAPRRVEQAAETLQQTINAASVPLPAEQTLAKRPQPRIGGVRVLQDTGNIRVDVRIAPGPLNEHRDAEARRIGRPPLALQTQHEFRIELERKRAVEQIGGADSTHAHQRARKREIFGHGPAIGETEPRAQLGEISAFRRGLLPAGQRRPGQRPYHSRDVDAAELPVLDPELHRSLERGDCRALARARRPHINGGPQAAVELAKIREVREQRLRPHLVDVDAHAGTGDRPRRIEPDRALHTPVIEPGRCQRCLEHATLQLRT